MEMEPYVVRQGDHLKAIAYCRGFDVEEVWNDPKNADLKTLRTSYNVLLPGDILYIPLTPRKFLSVNVGEENVFVATIPRCKITHIFAIDEEPLANLKFTVSPASLDRSPHTTDGDGTASFDVPVNTKEVRITFETGVSFVLAIGHLDPASSRSGCIQRLRHLGYLDPSGVQGEENSPQDSDDATSEQWVDYALGAFQKDNGLEVTGTLDDATARKLVEKFGS
jgi:hypothetical protein